MALTGFEFGLSKLDLGEVIALGFSNEWARPGQVLDGRPSQSNPPVQMPLLDTPNWDLVPGAPNEFATQTANVNYGLSHFGNIFAATRIVGGGDFQFTFEPALIY